jgi:oligopeptide/dipeptide ABC transporter ATP-binding protein
MSEPVLQIDGLRVVCSGGAGDVVAVDGVDLVLAKGEVVGLIGESGSGKTSLVRAVIGLLARSCRPVGGRIRMLGEPVFGDGVDRLRDVRGRHVGMIFQQAAGSLNPLLKIGVQLRQVLRAHTELSGQALRPHVVALLERLGFADVRRVLDSYPHQLSGGMSQRAAIALAVATEPDLVIADECTSALDVTTQAEVVALLRDVTAARNWTLLFVTHDVLLATELCTRLVVLYGGQVVEDGPTAEVVAAPRHPYTRALLEAVPLWQPRTALRGIAGAPPNVLPGARGCPFAERCAFVQADCTADDVGWTDEDGRGYRCLHPLPAEPR